MCLYVCFAFWVWGLIRLVSVLFGLWAEGSIGIHGCNIAIQVEKLDNHEYAVRIEIGSPRPCCRKSIGEEIERVTHRRRSAIRTSIHAYSHKLDDQHALLTILGAY